MQPCSSSTDGGIGPKHSTRNGTPSLVVTSEATSHKATPKPTHLVGHHSLGLQGLQHLAVLHAMHTCMRYMHVEQRWAAMLSNMLRGVTVSCYA
jgi:hypothetical protein